MNEENQGLSLREAIDRGFERLEAEEAAQQTGSAPADSAQNSAEASGTVAQTDESGAQAHEASPASDTPPAQEQPAGQPVQQSQGISMEMLAQAFSDLRSENARLREMVSQQNAAMNQQSEMAEQAAEQVTNLPAVPALDLHALQYMSEEEQASAVSAWQTALQEAMAARMRSEIDPIRQDYEEKRRLAAYDSARSAVSRDPRFSDFEANAADIEQIAANPDFAAMDPHKRLVYSTIIARGLRNDPAKAPSTEEIIRLVESNPDALRAIETRRAQQVQKQNETLPTLSGSTGFGGANPVPENHVKTKEDLDDRVMRKFGLA